MPVWSAQLCGIAADEDRFKLGKAFFKYLTDWVPGQVNNALYISGRALQPQAAVALFYEDASGEMHHVQQEGTIKLLIHAKLKPRLAKLIDDNRHTALPQVWTYHDVDHEIQWGPFADLSDGEATGDAVTFKVPFDSDLKRVQREAHAKSLNLVCIAAHPIFLEPDHKVGDVMFKLTDSAGNPLNTRRPPRI